MEEHQEKDVLFAFRHKDGAVSLYADEDWAMERGIDPEQLVLVEIPRELFSSGTVQELREYVATYLESQENQTPS